MTSPRATWKSLLAAFPAIALFVVAIWEIAASARAGAWEPSEADWASVSDMVRERFEPGDLIVFAPRWMDPVGRLHLGDRIPIEAAARMDADRFAVVWEISARGARAAEAEGRKLESERHAGSLTIRRYTREPVEVLSDFVALVAAGKGKPGGNGTGRPTVSLEEVGFEPHRCIRIIPKPGKTATLKLPSVRIGGRLVGYAGLADVFTRRDVREPGRLEVVVNGTVVSTTTLGVDDGWVRFEAATSPGVASVEFRATAVGPGARDRRICFAAEARR